MAGAARSAGADRADPSDLCAGRRTKSARGGAGGHCGEAVSDGVALRGCAGDRLL